MFVRHLGHEARQILISNVKINCRSLEQFKMKLMYFDATSMQNAQVAEDP